MTQFYKIAGLTVAMDTFGRTERQAAPYRIELCGEADFAVTSYRETVQQRYPGISRDEAEYLGTGGGFYKELLRFDGFQLHAAAVVADGKAYLFSASSGTGKSTHAELWLELLGSRAFLLNDDKPALRRVDGQWYAFGTPWSGKHDRSVNTAAPVAGIALLEQAAENEIRPLSGGEAAVPLFAQTNRPRDGAYREKLLELLDSLLTAVPVWKLRCNRELQAAAVAFDAMAAGR